MESSSSAMHIVDGGGTSASDSGASGKQCHVPAGTQSNNQLQLLLLLLSSSTNHSADRSRLSPAGRRENRVHEWLKSVGCTRVRRAFQWPSQLTVRPGRLPPGIGVTATVGLRVLARMGQNNPSHLNFTLEIGSVETQI